MFSCPYKKQLHYWYNDVFGVGVPPGDNLVYRKDGVKLVVQCVPVNLFSGSVDKTYILYTSSKVLPVDYRYFSFTTDTFELYKLV